MKKTALFLLSAACALTLPAWPVCADEDPNAASGTESWIEVEEAADGVIFKSLAFSVTVPGDISEISDIYTLDNEIEFYEKISREEFGGGFVASVGLYDSVKDYAFMPSFGRGGQIEFEDGTKKDIVITYPTDVQFDPENEECRENYHKISEAFNNVILETIRADGGTYIPQSEIDTDAVYADTIAAFSADLAAQKDAEGLSDDGFSYLYSYLYSEEGGALASAGYACMDLDGDGYDELLLGSLNDSAIYDLFTQIDGEVIHVFSGGERDVYELLSTDGEHPGVIRNTASGGAFYTVIHLYCLFPGTGELTLQESFVYDSDSDPENPFRIEYGKGIDPDVISEEEWNERQSYFGEVLPITYTALAG